jgi:hypothetical protein
MTAWSNWQDVSDEMNLSEHGASIERQGADVYRLDLAFPNYQRFWRRHVVPATERPKSVYLRPRAAEAVERVKQCRN